MKPLLLLGCLLLGGTAMRAQFSLLPYAGFEQSRNRVTNTNGLSASDISRNLRAGLKMDYRLKGGHGPFISLGTSPAPVSFRFNNLGSVASSYEAAKGALQFRMEGGYQYSSRPISLGKKRTAASPSASLVPDQSAAPQKTCGSLLYKSRCGERKALTKASPVNKTLNMRLQPLLALAYIPSATESVKQTASGFEYTAAPKTALVPAMGFEFAKGSQRLLTLGLFYSRALGQKEQTVNSLSGGKAYTTTLSPRTSTWGLTLGIPIGLTKTKAVKQMTETRQRTEKRSCTQSHYRRCMQWQ
ncbi:hypothetical protein [Flavisolibacter nicotianae]|uniref:hypothetical protein n=1 Tax=Flavisolibacter nicotianae TaxID=2364882 RepID=UPI000EAF0E57|nr:hypothetical protein [Flavisolibacter nicotianae]